MHIGLDNDDGFNYDPSYSYASGSGSGPASQQQQQQQESYGAKEETADGGYGDVDAEEMDGAPIGQEDYWTVISAYFEGKGLVRQQLESFNEFVENTIQEIVDENSRLTLDQYTQYTGNQGDETVGRVLTRVLN